MLQTMITAVCRKNETEYADALCGQRAVFIVQPGGAHGNH